MTGTPSVSFVSSVVNPAVVQLGMSRSGSTAVWQAMRAMVEEGPEVVKAHEFDAARAGVPHVITVRDPLDCAASWCVATRSNPAEVEVAAVLGPAVHSGWQVLEAMRRTPDALWLRYEWWWHRPVRMVRRVMAFLRNSGVGVVDLEAEAVAAHVNTDENRRRAEAQGDSFQAWCPETMVHGLHVSDDPAPGKWRRVFPEAMWVALEEEAKPMREALGYGES